METSLRASQPQQFGILQCLFQQFLCCDPEESAPTNAQEEEDDEVIDMEWFYWTCGAVYISTCLALFVFLCIDTRWSQEWFYRVDLFIHHLQRSKRSAFRN
ncbi:unnamed protein product [Microthlaspi erraticum]|uniref:Uncharacterized protein n=1 Tax=Microthlaspi erraticum TaxID=1685480 RepID=A0A6D2HDH0_9BRAS|nr:unnamed protein product [Microthlaspi erraticum]